MSIGEGGSFRTMGLCFEGRKRLDRWRWGREMNRPWGWGSKGLGTGRRPSSAPPPPFSRSQTPIDDLADLSHQRHGLQFQSLLHPPKSQTGTLPGRAVTGVLMLVCTILHVCRLRFKSQPSGFLGFKATHVHGHEAAFLWFSGACFHGRRALCSREHCF